MENQIKIILNCFASGHFNKVIDKTKKILKTYPQNSYLYNLLGSAYSQNGDTQNATINFELSIKHSPKNIAALNNLANIYKKNTQYKLAEKYYMRILDLEPNYVNGLINYANLKIDLNEPESAIKMLDKAIEINPNNSMAHFNLATTYLTLGKNSKALEHALESLKIDPNFSPTDKLISVLKKYSINDDHFIKIKKNLMDENVSEFNKIYLNFSIAKAYEDMGDTNKFIEHIIVGNNLKKKNSRYNIVKDVNLISDIKSSFTNFDYSKINLSNNKKIIFVVGMPRSGTSLVEQILSSHSQIYGAGELPFLKKIILEKFNKDFFVNDSFSNLNQMSRNYLEKISSYPNQKSFILDKNPLNFIWIGFIKLLFPKAKIIHIKRNAKDTCFSCFKQLFENIHFADDQSDLAQFYNSYNDLMDFWNLSLKKSIHTLNYEDLINSPKLNIDHMLKFCELDFEEKCLNFNENQSPVKTKSASQVRLPIYKSSINSYKDYENKLRLLFNNLK